MKIASICILFIFLFSTALADEWTNYRFEEEPDYVISLPSSYYVVYRDMPLDSPILQMRPLTPEQFNSLLDFNNSFAIAYTPDFSTTITIAKFPDVDVDNMSLDELTSKELEIIREGHVSMLKEGLTSNELITLESLASEIIHTPHAQYVAVYTELSVGLQQMQQIQYSTITNGDQLIITFLNSIGTSMDEFRSIARPIVWNTVIF
ncbi:MAG: hypothetical protein J6M47_01350 [Clostridia bacterium]|nr:hypothetical protein [Clostridia bacterium]